MNHRERIKKYELAVFDVDGTMLDTTEGVVASVEYTIGTMGLAPLKREQLLTFIGPPIQDSFARIYRLEGEALQAAADCFRNRYKDYDLFRAAPYEGMESVLETLSGRGIKVAVATYKRQDYAESIVRHFGLDRYVGVLYGTDYANRLTKGDIIRKCMEDMGVCGSAAVMIGDTCHDAGGAEEAGMDFIGVTYGVGFRSPEEIYQTGAVGAADSPAGLLRYF